MPSMPGRVGGSHPEVEDQLLDLAVRLGLEGLALVRGEGAGELVAPALEDRARSAPGRPRVRTGTGRPTLAAPRRRRRSPGARRRVRLSASEPITRPVAGLVASNVSPEAAALQRPSTYIAAARTAVRSTVTRAPCLESVRDRGRGTAEPRAVGRLSVCRAGCLVATRALPARSARSRLRPHASALGSGLTWRIARADPQPVPPTPRSPAGVPAARRR